MSSVSGSRGVYAVDWAQTAPGDEWGLPPEHLSVGMTWRWRGGARRLDAGVETLWLDLPVDRGDPRHRARNRLRRLALAEIPATGSLSEGQPEIARDTLTLSDGRRVYGARLVRQGARMLAVFDPVLPPPDHDLWVTGLNLDPAGERHAGVICFLPGTRIATPEGPRVIETLAPGDLVSTRDNGPQPLLWRGETRLSGAELYLYPHLRPLRLCAEAADLLISPGHRLLMPLPEGLGGDREALVAAEDLIDGRRLRRDYSLTSVRYLHLMFGRHQILTANGHPCESFHPALADTRVLAWHARSLEKAMPGVACTPARYGETVRRCLAPGETAILRLALA